MKRRHRAAWAVVALLVASGGSSGWAAAASDADKLIREGLDLRRGGDDAAALQKFQRALELWPTPRAVAQIGLAEQALGRWVVAYEHLRRALDATGDPWIQKSRSALEAALDHVSDHVGQVQILGGSPGTEVRIDGAPRGKLPLERALVVSTGTVTIDLVAPGLVPIQRTTLVHARESIRESFDTQAPLLSRDGVSTTGVVKPRAIGVSPVRAQAPPMPGGGTLSAMADPADGSPASATPDASSDGEKDAPDDRGSRVHGGGLRKSAKWVAWGVGAVALGVGAFGWARQNQAANDFSSGGCRTNPRATITTVPGASRSIADCQNLESKVNSNYRLELIGLVGAGVLAAAGLVLWITEPTPPVSDTTALSCTPELTLALAPRLTCQLRF